MRRCILSIDRDDFDTIPMLQRSGGWRAANRAFGGELAMLLVDINGQWQHERRIQMANTQRFTAMIYREDDGYVALCPELDVASQGHSIEDATVNLREAVELFLETASPSEVASRTHGDVYVAALEVRAG